MTPTMSLRSPADMIAAIPYLLGFHPTESMVVVGMRDQRIEFAARGDLDAPPGSVDYYTAVVLRQDVEAVAVLGYGPADLVDGPVKETSAALEEHGLTLIEALRVSDDRYWSYLCANPECCPPDGVPYDVASSDIAVAATLSGQVALPDRQALVRRIEPVSHLARESMRQATERADARLAEMLGAVAPGDVLGGRAVRDAGAAAVRAAVARHREGGQLTDDEVAWLTVLLVHLPVRDYAWEHTGHEDWFVDLWADVVRRAEEELVAGPASLLAYAAWRSGQGALAHAGIDRALAADPAYAMALLMRDVLQRAIPPSTLDQYPVPEQTRAGAWRPRAPRRARA
ncbi:DUF4192 domain-containing protein [Phytohabitans aurantiacus]|uniref:DUF4192 domain-containing protein n=1 Tax=Phytohabitans aurantiacus TaxID=3016789 RepID=A0ABQ5QLT2_9ACTN|nr:DUF4192 domain-containing protein [Phytohabitans aurantiacus]GLH95179.1 hypothetical protein Pa4123_04510 [Phytohabitans aurantiacus]